MNHNKRIIEIDVLKGFGILLMVIGHMHIGENIEKYIYSFHMPLFFIISGYLFSKRPMKQVVISRFRSLLLPYLLFGAVYSTVYIVLHMQPNEILNSLRSYMLYPTEGVRYESALWFLPVMFFVTVLYAFFENRVENTRFFSAVIIIIGICGFIIPHLGISHLPFGLGCCMVGILFFHIGRIIKKFDLLSKICNSNHKNRNIILIILTGLPISLVMTFLNDTINMREMRWGVELLSIVNAVISFFAYYFLCFFVVSINCNLIVKYMSTVGFTSIIYLCLNHLVIKACSFVTDKALSIMNISYRKLRYLIIFLFASLVLYVISIIVYKTKLKVIFGKHHYQSD